MGSFSLNDCFHFESPNFVSKGDRLRLQPKVTAILRDLVCPSSNKLTLSSFRKPKITLENIAFLDKKEKGVIK